MLNLFFKLDVCQSTQMTPPFWTQGMTKEQL